MTAEDLWKLPPDRHVELTRGELRELSWPYGFEHGAIAGTLGVRLAEHAKQESLGVVSATGTGFHLRSNPDTVRAPDIAFVRAARIPAAGLPEQYFPGAPDLAVEVLSPEDRVADIDEKIEDYFAAGTPLIWIVNPRRKTVTIHKPDANPITLGQADTLDGGDVLPGFRCLMSEIFE
ncbi:MAG TPA: Uma2 family endonuclease [Tepidisphaeraceae bacterium]